MNRETQGMVEGPEALFRALAHPIRLQILRALRAGPRAYTDLRRRAGPVVETPSASKGKFNYHLDILTRTALVVHEDDAYRLGPLGLDALRLADLSDPVVAERQHAAAVASQRAEAILRGVRGLLAGTASGALLVSFVLLAHAATTPAPGDASVPLSTLATWGLLGVLPAALVAALTPLPDTALLPPGVARPLRAGALATLAGAASALPILLHRALSAGDGFATQGPPAISTVGGASLLWLLLLHARTIAQRALRDARPPDPASEPSTDLHPKEERP